MTDLHYWRNIYFIFSHSIFIYGIIVQVIGLKAVVKYAIIVLIMIWFIDRVMHIAMIQLIKQIIKQFFLINRYLGKVYFSMMILTVFRSMPSFFILSLI